MNKRTFLKTGGLIGAAAILPTASIRSITDPMSVTDSCILIPTETAGPFPLDLTSNTNFFRQDVREGKPGTPLRLKLQIVGDVNCAPMQNVRVNIWHCDANGLYSGYSQSNNAGQAGLTYLRGYQLTDVNGEASFLTIFPGWYNGRVCHIHFQVYVSSNYAAISQLTFDVAAKQAVYAANATVYTKGADPTAPGSDNIFSDGYAYQTATLIENTTEGGYDAFLRVTVRGTGVTSVGHAEKETAKHFVLGQNAPNPFVDHTTIPLTLFHPSSVVFDLYDLQGRRVHSRSLGSLDVGVHDIPVNIRELGLPQQSYVYQVTVRNGGGEFVDVKRMSN
ncbi:MAG: hypothetical protein JSS89_06080 [Bacteroidetes bacterium]|nr:hypothetical protein [Bacteroidota bacterium]